MRKTGNTLLSFMSVLMYYRTVLSIGLSLLQYHVPTNNHFTSARIFRRFCNGLL